ncbi:hypothetical protein M426DRAFT_319176 [Hypoxylon sp. CI-4A]|nr:hypothetical protein M426DRAFT_319176 [Hypoxylon sp. CI-4A]
MASLGQSASAELYFAFGSNMHLNQMGKRCPKSILDSKGRLYNYKWQINHRGVANIVKGDPKDFVEGLLFVVTPRDVVTLDRNEGVSKGFYKKVYLQVEREPLLVEPPSKVKTNITATAQWLEEYTCKKAQTNLPSSEPTRSAHQSDGGPEESRSNRPDYVEALVYVSDEIRDGEIRLEYVSRMRSAMFDAQELGVSKTYLETCLDPLISARDKEIALVEQAAPEHAKSRSDQHPEPTSRAGGHRDGESRRRERRHALDEVEDTGHEHRRRRRRRGEGSREPRRHHNDALIEARDSQIAPRQREAQRRRSDTGLEDNRESTRSSSHESHGLGSWLSEWLFQWRSGGTR